MRFVVFGAGGIGGVIGARLHQSGHDVTLIARGAHREAIAERGLTLESPSETVTLAVPVVASAAEVVAVDDETPVVILAVKSHDTETALRDLIANVPPDTAIVCAQNGVANERRVSRVLRRVYAMCVMCPTTHIQPGVVQAHSAPVTGLLDLGVFPSGVDPTSELVCKALTEATFDSQARPDVMRWKYAKLLTNLTNALEALCGPGARGSDLDHGARAEGEAVLRAAGIDFASEPEDVQRRGHLLHLRATSSGRWSGGSSWQSLARSTGSIEVDFLNGEIVLLGLLHGVETPVNALLQNLASEAARRRLPPGQFSVGDIAARLAATRA